MFIQTWGEVFSLSLQNLWLGFVDFVPNLIIAIILFILGWFVGNVVGKAVGQIFSALKLDALFKSVSADKVLGRMGLRLDIGKFFAELVKWFIIVLFLVTSLDVLGLNQVNAFLREVVLLYLPKVIIAALILVLASVISDFMRKAVAGSAAAMGVKNANLMGSVAYYAIWIFAFIIAFSELGIATQFMQILFTGIVAMLAIAMGLAFGLGGKDAASDAIKNLKDQMK